MFARGNKLELIETLETSTTSLVLSSTPAHLCCHVDYITEKQARRSSAPQESIEERLSFHIAKEEKNAGFFLCFISSYLFPFFSLNFGVFALHGLVENLDIGEDRFPVRSVQGHHVIHVQKRVHAEFLIRDLKCEFEVLLPGLRC